MKIPFNKTYQTGDEEMYMIESVRSGAICGNHKFCKKTIELMKRKYGFNEVFLVPSGTAALEMGAMLAGIGPGDEVILPSYTFSSTANAIAIFGAKPVFCEVDPKTMNMDPNKVEALITSKTKMLLPIDYAGLPCEIEKFMKIAEKYNLIVMQDCAQSYGSIYKGKPCGTVPHLATFSFHETKNYSAGEGGALIVNKPEWVQRATFLQEKGTDRSLVINGMKNKYSWVDKGSSYLLSDCLAAMLYAQLLHEDEIKAKRGELTKKYFEVFLPFAEQGVISILKPNEDQKLNHHAFWVLFDTLEQKLAFMAKCKEKDVYVYIGYMPLHSAPYGLELGYEAADLPITESIGERIARLPFYTSLADEGLEYTIDVMTNVMKEIYSK